MTADNYRKLHEARNEIARATGFAMHLAKRTSVDAAIPAISKLDRESAAEIIAMLERSLELLNDAGLV